MGHCFHNAKIGFYQGLLVISDSIHLVDMSFRLLILWWETPGRVRRDYHGNMARVCALNCGQVQVCGGLERAKCVPSSALGRFWNSPDPRIVDASRPTSLSVAIFLKPYHFIFPPKMLRIVNHWMFVCSIAFGCLITSIILTKTKFCASLATFYYRRIRHI
jgi:hypothetical protein